MGAAGAGRRPGLPRGPRVPSLRKAGRAEGPRLAGAAGGGGSSSSGQSSRSSPGRRRAMVSGVGSSLARSVAGRGGRFKGPAPRARPAPPGAARVGTAPRATGAGLAHSSGAVPGPRPPPPCALAGGAPPTPPGPAGPGGGRSPPDPPLLLLPLPGQTPRAPLARPQGPSEVGQALPSQSVQLCPPQGFVLRLSLHSFPQPVTSRFAVGSRLEKRKKEKTSQILAA